MINEKYIKRIEIIKIIDIKILNKFKIYQATSILDINPNIIHKDNKKIIIYK